MGFFDNFLDDEMRLIRDTCKTFAEREIAPFADDWERNGTFPRELYKKAAAAGILGVGFAASVGGSGGGAMQMLMMIEGMMRGRSTGVAVSLGSLGIALPPIIAAGDRALIDRYARPVLAGEMIAALAITEPGAGSDVAGIRTSAHRDGDEYVVNGSKMFITSGVRADLLTTLVRTGDDPHGGVSFLAIETSSPGVQVSRPLEKHGWCASDTAEIFFQNVRVPAANLIGGEGAGFPLLMRNFQSERLALAGYGYVTAELALEEARRYAAERMAFGRPIGKFQTTRHKIVDMATRTVAAKTMVYQVASRLDAGEYCVREVSMAKNVAAETAVSVSYDAVQIFGGLGYMRETFVERLSRDARILPIGGGTQEIMKEIIAKAMGL
ncbi:MAG: acyl-CoA dehydrogenase family protein [Candidatus Schekmanbacteria bacterium]|nr:acyl-CoA dehydrogenase family protein [Candidatus Schekmanbacteria bacterium]